MRLASFAMQDNSQQSCELFIDTGAQKQGTSMIKVPQITNFKILPSTLSSITVLTYGYIPVNVLYINKSPVNDKNH